MSTVICTKCGKHLDDKVNMLYSCGLICGECTKRWFLKEKPGAFNSNDTVPYPDCKKGVKHDELHADVPSEKKRDEGPLFCPYKRYGCNFWGTAPEIDQHVHYSCFGKTITDMMFRLEQLTKNAVSQHEMRRAYGDK